jgi:hypothetical protein
MGATFNIMLFLGTLAFAVQLGCGYFGNNSLLDPNQCSTPYNDIVTNGFNAVNSQFITLLTVFVAIGLTGAIFVGSVSFPNPYAIFGLITYAIVIMGVLPSAGFAVLGVPEPYNGFLVGMFKLAWLFAALAGYRVGD